MNARTATAAPDLTGWIAVATYTAPDGRRFTTHVNPDHGLIASTPLTVLADCARRTMEEIATGQHGAVEEINAGGATWAYFSEAPPRLPAPPCPA